MNPTGTTHASNTTTQAQDHDTTSGGVERLSPSTHQPPIPPPPSPKPPSPRPPSPQPPIPPLPSTNIRGDGTTPPSPEVPGHHCNRDDSEDTGQDGNNPQKWQCLQPPPGGSINSEASNMELMEQATGNIEPPQVQKGKGGKGEGTKKPTKATPQCNAKKGGKA